MELRPLFLGEIFTRTATLYVRYFLPFALVALAVTFPLSIVQYALDRIAQPQLDALVRVLERTPVNAPALPNVAISPSLFGVEALEGLLAYAAATVVFTAIAAGVARLYEDAPATFAACYGSVLRAWRQIAAVVSLGVLLFLAWDVSQTLLALLFVGAAGSTAKSLAAIAPLAGLVVSTVMVLTFALLVVTLAFASFGVVVERRTATSALRESFKRIFTRAESQRAMLVSIAFCVTFLAGAASLNAITLAAGHLAWGAAAAVAVVVPHALLRATIAPFQAILFATYYFDVRIRHEGYDVELGLARIAAGRPAGAESAYAPTAYLSGVERAVVKRFLERRGALDAGRRAALAARLAAPARERVPQDLRGLDDESLLERL